MLRRANRTRPYFEAKRTLEELQRFRQILDAKIAYEKIDVELPKTMMVEIVDKAVPGLRPVRPNKPLNIAFAIIVGGVSGFVLATLVYTFEGGHSGAQQESLEVIASTLPRDVTSYCACRRGFRRLPPR